jgi:hypothetical protein
MHAERCRTKRLLSMACATLSNKTNLCENCYNPPYCASRRAEAPGYARRSPPVRAMADYFFKDHHFGRCVGSAMFISPFQAQLIHCPNSFFRNDFW